ncbi:MAG: type VII toxin-antitoxin system MntA family adenylyltransferase antitoxin [Candidatus Asgardarchaeia archaeon]
MEKVALNQKYKEAIDKITKNLKKNPNVIFAYLYGSIVKGTTHRFSDIDIAVYLKDASTEKFLEVLACIPDDVPFEVDIKDLNTAPPLLRYFVIKDGLLLFTKNRKLLANFKYKTLLIALDIKDDIEKLRKMRLERFLSVNK